jgi:hypothetical protein
MAVDLVNQRAWFRVDGGNWNNNASYNPSTNTGGFDISSLFGGGIEARVYAAPSATATGTTATLNVGASSFAYTVPSGFSGLSTPTFNYSTAVDGTSGVDGTATFRAGCRFSQTLVLSSPQPQQAGYLYAYPKFARGSMTYWLDPLVQLS